MNQLSTKIIADLYLSGMNIKEVCERSGETERVVKSTLRELGIARTRSESIAISKQRTERQISNLDRLEQKEAAPCFKAHELFSRAH